MPSVEASLKKNSRKISYRANLKLFITPLRSSVDISRFFLRLLPLSIWCISITTDNRTTAGVNDDENCYNLIQDSSRWKMIFQPISSSAATTVLCSTHSIAPVLGITTHTNGVFPWNISCTTESMKPRKILTFKCCDICKASTRRTTRGRKRMMMKQHGGNFQWFA